MCIMNAALQCYYSCFFSQLYHIYYIYYPTEWKDFTVHVGIH